MSMNIPMGMPMIILMINSNDPAPSLREATVMDNTHLRLWQLINPTLPIGAFAYSQAQEYAVDAGWINDEASARAWIEELLREVLSVTEVPVLARCYRAARQQDWPDFVCWNQILLAMRESSELYQEDIQLGAAMLRVFPSLGIEINDALVDRPLSYAAAFGYACAVWEIALEQAVQGFLWAWCETQVAAAIKLVPLGQSAGQRTLSVLREQIAAGVARGLACEDDDIGMLAPGFAMASARHEQQYSRLFRS
ncbi:MAG: urease accessory protein UreF [Gammaproteobacteria bacterium]|nr:urease accessory protein UreF [Gammaproteobacteria bacterium]